MNEDENTKMTVDFNQPPVTEVVIGVQFRRLSGLRAPLVGDLHRVFAEDYPKYQERPPLEPLAEKFSPTAEPQIRFQVTEFPSLPRLWFVTESGEHLIQIQQDRFLCNWRRTTGSSVYPRFRACYATFCENLDRFTQFLSNNGLGPLVPTAVELLYVNHFSTISSNGKERSLADVTPLLTEIESGEGPEEIQLNAHYPIRNGDVVVGRIQASFSRQVHRSSNQSVFELRLNCRGKPLAQTIEGAKKFLELAHQEENRVFLTLTSPELQNEWGRQ